MASTDLRPAIWKDSVAARIIAGMTEELGKTFIRAWRLYRGMNQEQLADAIGVTTASLSRIETGKQPYNQRQIELIAKALNCKEGDLLSKDPTEEEEADIVDIWDHIPAGNRQQARQILETFTDKKKA